MGLKESTLYPNYRDVNLPLIGDPVSGVIQKHGNMRVLLLEDGSSDETILVVPMITEARIHHMHNKTAIAQLTQHLLDAIADSARRHWYSAVGGK